MTIIKDTEFHPGLRRQNIHHRLAEYPSAASTSYDQKYYVQNSCQKSFEMRKINYKINSSCSRTCSLRCCTYPWWASSSSNCWAQDCCWSSLTQLLRDSTLYSCFVTSDLCFHNISPVRAYHEKVHSFLPKKLLISCGKIVSIGNLSWFNLSWLENTATGFPVLVGSWDELDIKFCHSEW